MSEQYVCTHCGYVMVPTGVEPGAGWEESARQYARNADYYRGLVHEIGLLLGAAARTADDSSVAEDVLCAKVPGLVRAQLAAAQEAREMAKARVKEMEALVTNAAVRRYEALAKMEYRAEQAERDKVELLGVEKKLLDEVEQAEAQLERTGYRRCDIPACNCGGWHPGERSAYAEADRLRSHLKALRAALSNLLQQARPVSMGWRKVRLEVTMEPEVYDALRALLAEPGA